MTRFLSLQKMLEETITKGGLQEVPFIGEAQTYCEKSSQRVMNISTVYTAANLPKIQNEQHPASSSWVLL